MIMSSDDPAAGEDRAVELAVYLTRHGVSVTAIRAALATERASERERCIQACVAVANDPRLREHDDYSTGYADGANDCLQAIRQAHEVRGPQPSCT
jgi:hypothetical protein